MNNTDKERFMSLLRPVYPRLERFAMTLTRNRDDAKDIVAETVCTAFAGFASLRDDKAFLSFVFTIASRAAQSRKFRKSDYATPEQIEELYSNHTSPETAADIAILYEALDKLSPEARQTIVMAEITGLSHKEIQQAIGGSISAIKTRIFRAKKRLAELLGVMCDHETMHSLAE